MAQPATTTPRPKYSQEMAIEEFIRQYEFWCASEGHDDEERIARGFVFCFESLLRGTIMRAYENSNTWDQMKQTCANEIAQVYDVVDFSSAEQKFERLETYQNYHEKLGVFKERFKQNLSEYESARHAANLSRWTERERVKALCLRLKPQLKENCFKRAHSIHTLDDVYRVCREFLASQALRRESGLKLAALSEDPHAKAVRVWDPQRGAMRSYYEGLEPRAGATVFSPTDSGGHGQLVGTLTRNDDEDQFPLNPARATHHGRPAGQIETTSRVITKMWAEHEQNMQALLDKHYQKVKGDLNRNFQHEPQAAEKEENKVSQALAKLPPEPQRPRQDKFDSRGFPVYDGQPFLAHQMEPQNRICVVKVDGVQRCLWCDARDHNTMCCIQQCPRCAGSHGIHD